ncbi:molybdopterin converting factor subunit 1 [Colwelliaceae bacterium BS250]
MINVLFFAVFKEQLDCPQLTIDNTDIVTVDDLQQQLITRGEQWQKVLSTSSLLIAVNHTMVSGDHKLNDNDEVAFFPPVTGG